MIGTQNIRPFVPSVSNEEFINLSINLSTFLDYKGIIMPKQDAM